MTDVQAKLEALLVASVVAPIHYRVYPDTPLSEIVELMVRRGVRAVPVVGESSQVLGIITAGDALGHALRDRVGSETSGERTTLAARDIMTRAVLCVSETQHLLEAAQMLVHRDVEQLPVVREGRLVGLLTRDAILRALHPSSQVVEEPRDDS